MLTTKVQIDAKFEGLVTMALNHYILGGASAASVSPRLCF